jgi:SAM-dependent MidA family methyltransferase
MRTTVRDEFDAIAESAPLVVEIRARIERDGPITFRDFMQAALYHPRYGYYRTHQAATSRNGDFVTSPELSPIFGAMVGRQLREFWSAMGQPARFDVVEQGAGRGLLARDIVSWADRTEPPFASAIHYTLVEPIVCLRDEQAAETAHLATNARIAWREEMPEGIEGCVITNELLDAFPVHRVARDGGELREVYVTHDGARFVDRLGAPSDPALARYFDRLGFLPGDGCAAEVNLEAPRWISRVAGRLRRGFVLTFDYGYEAAELYAPWRRDGTLICSYRQTASSDPYQRIGRQDISASVDFTTLRAAGEDAGLTTVALVNQSDFLLRMGIADAVAVSGDTGLEEYFARRNTVLGLVDPAGLGRIKVLLQSKGISAALFTGFADA